MALNFNSKHGILIGAVTLLAGVAITVSEVPRAYYYLSFGEYASYTSEYIIYRVGFSIYAILSVICSILLILGIVKKRHMLLAPWLIGGFLTALVDICAALYDLMTKTYFNVDDLLILFVIIGLQIVILYPIKHLYVEIRLENSAVNNNDYEKIYKNAIV